MKLVVGGRAQGKTEFARALAAEALREDGACAKEEAAYRGVTEADGRVDDVETAMRAAVILHVEAYVRRLMERGEDPFAFAERLLRENPEAVAAADSSWACWRSSIWVAVSWAARRLAISASRM